MKKLISVLCAMVLSVLLCIPVFADQTFTTTGNKSITLEYTVSPSYVVTIPSTVSFSDGIASINIAVSSLNIGEGQTLRVAVSNEHYSNNMWYLQDTASATNLLSYTVKLHGQESVLNSGPSFQALNINLESESSDMNKTFDFEITSDTPRPGTYQDVLTFSCTLTP